MNTPDPVCLIVPPSSFLLDERVFVNLGILKIAAVLEDADCQVEIVDLSGVKNFLKVLSIHLASSRARIFGITATTPQMPQITAITETIRSHCVNSKIIIGGPHVTLVHTAVKKELAKNIYSRACKEFDSLKRISDVLVSGDGEKAIFLAMEENSPRIIDADIRNSPLFISNSEFDKGVFPARHLIDMSSYRYTIDGLDATSVIGQLGCPFSCGFCGGRESPCLRIARIRTVQSITEEIRNIYNTYHYTGFMFYDDELNVNPHFLELLYSLSDLQEELGVSFHLRGFVKSELFNELQAKEMYRAGFRWILSGFESGAPRILSNIRKRATVDDNTACVRTAHKYGLKVKALMSLGHPGESHETIKQTRDWLIKTGPDDFDATIITPYPGTAYYDHAAEHPDNKGVWIYTIPENGDRLYNYETDYSRTAVFYKGDPDNGYRAFTYTDYLSSDELISQRSATELQVRAALGIPFNPGRAALQYDHSMGQRSSLPDFIVRSTYKTSELEPFMRPHPGSKQPDLPRRWEV